MPHEHAVRQHAEQETAKPAAETAEVAFEADPLESVSANGAAGAGAAGGGAEGPNKPVESALKQAPTPQARQTIFRRYQARNGNARAAHLAQRMHAAGSVQRHPAGAVIAPSQIPPAAAEVGGGGTAIPLKPDSAAPGAAPAATPGQAPGAGAAPAAAPASPGPAPAPGQQPAGPTPGGSQTQFGTGSNTTSGSGSISASTMNAATAQQAIQKAFGKVAGQPITGGKITVVDNKAALYALIDQFSMQDGDKSPDGKPWEAGFAEKYIDGRVLGFARKDSSIYIDKTGTDPTILVHEMLHVNASKDWQAAMPTSVDEGVTEDLAIQAVKASGFSASGSESTYPKEREAVGLMAGVVGSGTVTNAYFNGPTAMQAAYEAVMGAGTFAAFIAAMRAGNLEKAKKLLRKASNYAQKVTDLLSGWWVSDADVEEVIRIYGLVADDEKRQVRNAAQPLVTSLSNMGQRARLRIALNL